MKKSLLIFYLFLSCLLSAGQMPSRYPGLTHLYHFNKGLTIINSVTGVTETLVNTCISGTPISSTQVRYGYGLNYHDQKNNAGNDMYFDPTGLTLSKTTGWTIGFYIKIDTYSENQQYLAENYFYVSSNSRFIFKYQNDIATDAYADGKLCCWLWNNGGTSVHFGGTPKNNGYNDRRYHLIAVSYTPSDTIARMYFDNILLSSTTTPATQVANMTAMHIGATGTLTYYSHIIDELFIANRPFSLSEIENIWANYLGQDNE